MIDAPSVPVTEPEASAPTSSSSEHVLECRDLPLREWSRYGSYPSAEEAQEALARLVARMRPQGSDLRVVEVVTTTTRRVVEDRPFLTET